MNNLSFSWIQNGFVVSALYGGKTGLRLSTIYAVAGLLPLLFSSLYVYIFIGASMALVLGIIPSTIIGALTGSVIRFVLQRAARFLSSGVSILIGLSVTVSIAIAANLIFVSSLRAIHLYVLGIPSFIYVGAGGWAGYSIYTQLLSQSPSVGHTQPIQPVVTRLEHSNLWAIIVTLLVASLEFFAYAITFETDQFLIWSATGMALVVALIYVALRKPLRLPI